MLGPSSNKYFLFWPEFRNTRSFGAITLLKFIKKE